MDGYSGGVSVRNYELRCIAVRQRQSHSITPHEAKVKLVEQAAPCAKSVPESDVFMRGCIDSICPETRKNQIPALFQFGPDGSK